MTSLPAVTGKKLGLVTDLDICVGCHACATSCKEWNTSGYSAPLTDTDPYGVEPSGVWFNRVHSFETTNELGESITVNFPKSCLHCDDAPCVTVCPTGARSFGDLGDPESGVSKLVASRQGFDLMPEQGCSPVNKYLPPRPRSQAQDQRPVQLSPQVTSSDNAILKWLDKALSR